MPTFQRDGALLHYELDGSGAPVVYINGFSSHSNDVLSIGLRRRLAERYTVLNVDNRGAGQTVIRDNRPVTVEDMADDIAAVMDHHNLKSAHILGISMGGAIAMVLALRHPEKVRTLVPAVSLARSNVNGTRTEFLLRSAREMRDQGVPNEFINRFNAVYLLSEDLFQYEPFMNAWVKAPPDPFQQTRAGFDLQVAAMSTYDILDRLPMISIPTLVISSPDDLLVPPRFQQEIAQGIPNAEFREYHGGHIFMVLPMYRETFVDDVFAFWSRHEQQGRMGKS
ncbi:MAG: alpha/beta hydrolase [bacterium]|nr:alpha/beta hydrolase [bacterium]